MVMQEYFDSEHAELVPEADLEKPPRSVFYLPMHLVRKEPSSTTKLRAGCICRLSQVVDCMVSD